MGFMCVLNKCTRLLCRHTQHMPCTPTQQQQQQQQHKHRCGRRGGYFELVNASAAVHAEMYKLSSINLCANTGGQIAMATIMHPPKPGDPSFMLWSEEMVGHLKSLQLRARMVVDAMRGLRGVTCSESEVRDWWFAGLGCCAA